jgi:hypothetical protein
MLNKPNYLNKYDVTNAIHPFFVYFHFILKFLKIYNLLLLLSLLSLNVISSITYVSQNFIAALALEKSIAG